MKVLLLNGSPARPSHTSATLRHIAKLFEDAGHSSQVIDLIDAQIPINDPLYHADAMQSPDQKVKDLATTVKGANIVVLGTPLYHGSFSGLLKAALDNLDDDAFAGKHIMLVANASGIRGSMQAAQHLVVVPRTMAGIVYDRLIGTCKADFEQKDDAFVLTSDEIMDRCKQIVSEVLTLAKSS